MTNDDFRWQGFFQRTSDPFFVLDRQLRLRFVNRAWEAVAGMTAAEARGLRCWRPRPAAPGDSREEILSHALCPPPEVLNGATGLVRRLLLSGASRKWWDVAFFPLRDEKGVRGYLGKIMPVADGHDNTLAEPLPEGLVALRDRMAQRYGLEHFAEAVPAWWRLGEQVRLASQVDAAVLLVGEPGTGKAWLARTIHYQSPRRDRAFAAVDCGALPVAALEHLLFEGGLDHARIGTVYLREPGRLPRELQLKLEARLAAKGRLRFLAGCRARPEDEVRQGRLLRELYCQLGTLVLEVPSLRERLTDLPWLVERLLNRIADDKGQRVKQLTDEAWELVRGYPWPENVRELYAVLASARRRATGDRIDAADLPAYLRPARRLDETPGGAAEWSLAMDQVLEQVERRLIQLALQRAKNNKTRAAQFLAIPRPRLYRRMKELGFEDVEE
jgi:transcriptional regulator with PAS, ATPase and Fis domain